MKAHVFTCHNCGKLSHASGIEPHAEGPFVVCEFCDAHNRLHQEPGTQDDALELQVSGLIGRKSG